MLTPFPAAGLRPELDARTSPSPLPRRLMTVLLVLVAMAGMARPAAAQPGREIFPEPITSRDLDGYAKRLQLSEQQRVMADGLHAKYLESFRQLRDGDLAEYESRSTNMMRSLMMEPDAGAVKAMLRESERLMGRIESLDRQFFDELGASLSPEQLEAMPGVRQARDRERNQAGLVQFAMRSNDAAAVDLSVLMLELELDPDEWRRVEPTVRTYERSLTSGVEKVRDATAGMFTSMAEELEELGGAGDGGRPDFRRMREAWTEAAQPVAKQVGELVELNRRSYRTMRQMLSADPSRALEEEYLREAYPEVYRGRENVIELLDVAANQMPGLSDDERERIAAMRDRLAADHRLLGDRMSEVVDEGRAERGFMGFGRGPGGPDSEWRQELAAMREKQEQLNADARAALEAMLGADRMEELAKAASRELNEDVEGARRAASRGDERIAGRRPGGRGGPDRPTRRAGDTGLPGGPDRFIPAAISRQEVELMATVLGLGEAQAPVIDALYGTYRSDYEAVEAERIDPVLEMQEGMWQFNREERRIEAPTPAEIASLYEARRLAREAVRELDRAFFDDVALAAVGADDEIAQAKLASLRAMRARMTSMTGEGGGERFGMPGSRMLDRTIDDAGTAASIDLGWVAMTAELAPKQREELLPSLRAYDAEATPLFEQRMSMMFDVSRAMERRMAEGMNAERGDRMPGRGPGRPGGRGGPGGFMDEEQRGEIERLEDVNASIAALNERSLGAMEAALQSETAAGVLRAAYQRSAYPEVYSDSRSVEPLMRRALRLGDLSERQRSELSNLLMEYTSAYHDLSQRLIEEHASEDELQQNADRGRFETWEERRQIRQRIERLEFDRDELSDRTRRRLMLILTDAQQRELGVATPAG